MEYFAECICALMIYVGILALVRHVWKVDKDLKISDYISLFILAFSSFCFRKSELPFFIAGIFLVLVGLFVNWLFSKSFRMLVVGFSALLCSMFISEEMMFFMTRFETYASTAGYSEVTTIVSGIIPVVAYFPIVLYCIKKERGKFSSESMLLCTSILLFVYIVCRFLATVEVFNNTSSINLFTKHEISLVGSLISFLTLSCFALFSEGKYDRNITAVNNQMLNAQLSHYESVKQSNFEIRRIRHDMKNHLLVIRDMAEKGNRDELLEYIDSLSGEVAQSDVFYRSGNDIADAILADKNNKAGKRNITLEVSGDLLGVDIDAVDLCTIIANLLDNAIEAVSGLYNYNPSERHKIISLNFKKNANFLVIEQTNYSKNEIKNENGKYISSKNSSDHGFGLYNIKQAVRRNSGEFNISREDNEFIKYTFEIMLPLNNI